MGYETLSRSAKLNYEEYKLLNPGKGIDEFLFPTPDNTENASILLDRYISSPYGVAYREPGSKSVIRQFVNGSGMLVSPPVVSEATPIDSETKDLVLSGAEPTESYMAKVDRLVSRIRAQHTEAHNMTRFKQAIDVIRTGVFSAKGVGGKDLGLDITYTRDAGNSLTYDFTATGATMFAALKTVEVQARAQGTPLANFVAIVGSDWADKFMTDTGVQAYMQNNNNNSLLEANMMPAQLQNVDGLTVLARVRPVGMIMPVWVCTYQPATQYVAYKGATAAPWIPSTEAIFFSLADTRYRVNCGVDVLDDNGKAMRVVGDVVFDTFTDNDPVEEYFRSQRRNTYVPANANHTFKCVGTFS